MICPKCGKEFSNYLEKCPYCDYVVPGNENEKDFSYETSSNIYGIAKVLAAINIIVGIIVACIYILNFNLVGILVSIFFILSGIASYFILFGFARLVENSEKLVALQREQLDLLKK